MHAVLKSQMAIQPGFAETRLLFEHLTSRLRVKDVSCSSPAAPCRRKKLERDRWYVQYAAALGDANTPALLTASEITRAAACSLQAGAES